MGVQGPGTRRLYHGPIVNHEGFQRDERLEGMLYAFNDGATFGTLSIHCPVSLGRAGVAGGGGFQTKGPG
ncbi:hypothetical protein HBH70_061400 [Parastagonospora nodorum]|nr:hypothetical protein HBI03_060960 [Parastagonospora nodorum]KAH4279285.1 hypothetical protein HBI04_076410 [Parastagonospora nodorum]KAH4856434.1 hypothetical protein HBH75_078910 [Parastagonospora nodorum]KAH4967820.1 hypothetical protein HBI78_074350 [Parastagonospora nodorum]KAH5060399.1 hypothetical protein HBH96_083000 [Parastagonospora nodorum]